MRAAFDDLGWDPDLRLAAIHRKAVDCDAMNRRFFRIVLVRSHAERAAGNEQHVGMPLSYRPKDRFGEFHETLEPVRTQNSSFLLAASPGSCSRLIPSRLFQRASEVD